MELIFDIGYNAGKFAQACFETYPGCTVVGVEPNRSLIDYEWSKNSVEGQAHWRANGEFMEEAFEILAYNREHHSLKLIPALVAATNTDPVTLYLCERSPGVTTAAESWCKKSRFAVGSAALGGRASWNYKKKVQAITLDDLVDRYGTPDLIKVDVEGYEYEVLRGLTAKQKLICLEWSEELMEPALSSVEHLQQLGYEEFGVVGCFEEGQHSETVTFQESGDPPLLEPNNYYAWDKIELDKALDPSRRTNYGMLFAR